MYKLGYLGYFAYLASELKFWVMIWDYILENLANLLFALISAILLIAYFIGHAKGTLPKPENPAAAKRINDEMAELNHIFWS